MIRSVVIAGGGIGGLTTAIALRRVPGIEKITILEKHEGGLLRSAPASGIALWRNSLQIYDYLDVLPQLESVGAYMKENINYFSEHHSCLAKAPSSFTKEFPILCINREDLQSTLASQLSGEKGNGAEIVIKEGVSCQGAHSFTDSVSIDTNEDVFTADLLIGADGLHSKVRDSVFHASPEYCGYTYFRATMNEDQLQNTKENAEHWFSTSFESWGSGKRFGYVPLKNPSLFWFASIPSPPITANNRRITTTNIISESEKEIVYNQFKDYKSPIEIEKLIKATRHDQILRTDIYKVPVLPKWSSGRIVLLGDAVHATSPNLAQGAGLSIEDAMQLAHDINMVNQGLSSIPEALENYQNERCPRATTVQTMADCVALAGQTQWLAGVRNFTMSTATKIFPGLQQRIFKDAVRVSLGWNWKLPTFELPCLWERAIGKSFEELPLSMKHFRKARSGSGVGSCSVEYNNPLARLVGAILMFPSPMVNQKFFASVKNNGPDAQTWKRIFGYETNKATTYETTMKICQQGGPLMEQKGPFQFEYDILYDEEEKRIDYKTKQFNLLPGLPWLDFLSPYSEWFEVPTKDGWTFDGYISLPLVGKIFRYHGSFVIDTETK